MSIDPNLAGEDGKGGPSLDLASLPAEVHMDLLKLYSRMMIALDGFWYLSVKERTGNDEALACDNWVWSKVMKHMTDDLAAVLKVQGRSVADFMKVLEARPMHFVLGEKIQVLSRDHARLTVVRCPTLLALEKEGQGRDATHCREACTGMRIQHTKLFNPDMEVVCRKLPPRNGPDDIFCDWDYVMGKP